MISATLKLLPTARVTRRYSTVQMTKLMMMDRLTFFCGSLISSPLFVIVVNPLYARIERATAARNPVIELSEVTAED